MGEDSWKWSEKWKKEANSLSKGSNSEQQGVGYVQVGRSLRGK